MSNVPQSGVVNASCGKNGTNVVVMYDDTNSLDHGQSIRVLGTVEEPSEATNAMSGLMNFEPSRRSLWNYGKPELP